MKAARIAFHDRKQHSPILKIERSKSAVEPYNKGILIHSMVSFSVRQWQQKKA